MAEKTQRRFEVMGEDIFKIVEISTYHYFSV